MRPLVLITQKIEQKYEGTMKICLTDVTKNIAASFHLVSCLSRRDNHKESPPGRLPPRNLSSRRV